MGASLTAGRARSPDATPSTFLRSLDLVSVPTTGTLPVAEPGPIYFSRPIAPASGPGRRAESTATAVSMAVAVAASVLSDSAGSSAGSTDLGRAPPGAFAVTMTGILPTRAGSVGR